METQDSTPLPFPWKFFIITFAFSWLFWLFPVLSSQADITSPVNTKLLFVIGLFGPSLTGIFLTAREKGKEGLKKLLKRAIRFRIPLRWLAVILLLPVIVDGIALSIFNQIGGKLPDLPFWTQPLTMIPLFLAMFLNGPIPEEFGWRGYALDRLLGRSNALGASLVLGLIWSFWHLPMFYSNISGHEYMSFLPFMLFVCSLSILFTWVYNNTEGNLFAVILFHATLNFCFLVFALSQMHPDGDNRALTIATLIYAGVAALVVWIWGPSELKRVVQPDATSDPE
jgi:membrane protease YdiL (CAAX protease family)